MPFSRQNHDIKRKLWQNIFHMRASRAKENSRKDIPTEKKGRD
jgi:hypothetical protein